MSNKGLSSDIELAIKDSIEGLQFDLGVTDIEDNKMKAAVKSKISSFSSAKELLDKWINSSSSPSKSKIQKYCAELVDAGENAKEQMRKALRKKINWGELDADKRAAAQEAKPFILNSINELHSGIVKLRLQLDNEDINLKDKEFETGFPEKMARGELIDISSIHKDWYNEKEDSVKICPRGTEGEIIDIDGLKVQLPETPASKNNILFSDKPKTEQYWKRIEPPAGLIKETEDEYIDYIVEEFRRRVHGVWFMNNGKPTYLTGHLYFMLQWHTNDRGEYSNFRQAQAKLAYHAKACEVDPRCVGQIFVKSRRIGFTTYQTAHKLNLMTMQKNHRSGITSMNEDMAQVAFTKLMDSYRALPYFFKPVLKTSESSDKIWEAKEPSNNTKAAKKNKRSNSSAYLNSRCTFLASTEKAYDSDFLTHYLSDEYGKWWPSNYLSHWTRIKPTMYQNGVVKGKAFLGSTIEEYDKGGKAAMELWKESDPKERNVSSGMTISGLYRCFIPVQENHDMHIDKYGICHQTKPSGHPLNQDGKLITSGALEFLAEEAKQQRKRGSIEYNDYLRNLPRSIDDAFRMKVQDSSFNVLNIQNQLSYIQSIDVGGGSMVLEGDFSWKNGQQDTEVIWTPRKGGRFKISWIPPASLRNQMDWKNGHRAPKNTWLGAGGLDPFGKNQTQDGRGSKGSIHFINRPNANYPETSRQFVLEYIHRPPTLTQFYEDALMASVFYGYPIFYENDKSGIETYFEQRGYLEYLMLRPERYDSRKNKKIAERGAPSRGIMIDAIYYALHDYISDYIGELKSGDMGNMYFEDTLRDWMKFEPNNRTAYDASISSGYALCAIQVDPPKKQKQEKTTIDVAPFRMYNNRGNTSKTI